MTAALCIALSVVSVYAVGVTLLWRSSAASVHKLMDLVAQGRK